MRQGKGKLGGGENTERAIQRNTHRQQFAKASQFLSVEFKRHWAGMGLS